MAQDIIKAVVRTPDEAAAVASKLLSLPMSSTRPYTVIVRPFEKSRSLAQNNLFHMWIGVIAKETGNDNETIKTEMKRLYLGVKMVEFKHPKTGERRLIATMKSSADLSAKEMTSFMNNVHAWALHMGIKLPIPEELAWSIVGDTK